ncbi:MAG: pre-peptidase C-terminal domain-containing protein, partial [Blastocatellia bacterium]|nr:pre-peptidase C-terminal domain-containing protein [Blastocatellia bacterium]
MHNFFRQPHRLLGMTLFLAALCWMVSPWGLVPFTNAKAKLTRPQVEQSQEPQPKIYTPQEKDEILRRERAATFTEEPPTSLTVAGRVSANDVCSGAEVIPASGPFPYVSSIANISGNTSTGDPTAASCFTVGTNGFFSVWYTFTPTTTSSYRITTSATGEIDPVASTSSFFAPAPTFTSIGDGSGSFESDTILALYTSAGGCAGPFTQLTPTTSSCDDDAGAGGQSEIIPSLTAGTTYYILAYQRSSTAPTFPLNGIQIFVAPVLTTTGTPANDTCAGVAPLTLNTITPGTLFAAGSDFTTTAADAGWANGGAGNIGVAAAGRDVVYSFTAPAAGNYTFSVTNASVITGTSVNPAIYLASSCAAGTVTLLAGGNRTAGGGSVSGAERISCFPMTAGQQVFLFVDGLASADNYGFFVQVTQCSSQEAEPNDTIAQASTITCGMEAQAGTSTDVDFYALPSFATGSRVFAMVNGAYLNGGDIDLRVTTAADTLEFDSSDNTGLYGSSSSNVAGVPLTGVQAYLRVNGNTLGVGPYQLYSIVRAPGSETAETAAANNLITDAGVQTGDYFSGSISASGDSDLYRFNATAGDVMYIALDTDPERNQVTFNGVLDLLDANGNLLVRSNDTNGSSVACSSCTGTLTATTPSAPAEAILFTARTTGQYYVRVSANSGGGATFTYLVSTALNCTGSAPANTAPTFTPAGAISRQQGSPAGAAVTVGTAADAETAAGSLTVTQIAGGTATGITVTGITNSNGTITAMVAAGCTATSGTVRFQVTDGGGLMGTGDVTVNVTANSNPTLGTYGNTSVSVGAGTTVTPSAAPTDNGSVATVTATANPNTFTGTLSGNATTGVITVTNAGPAGTYTITVTATDNCGATATTTFTLTVNAGNTAPTFTPAGAISRQQGSPAGAAVTVGTAADAETAAGSLTVTQIAGGTATGITVTGITNSNGTITALVAAGCTATGGTVRFQVTDGGGLMGTGDLTVNVTANSNPTLGTYGNATLNVGAGTTVTPSAAPTDNGSVATVTATANPNTFTGTLSGNTTTGVITVTNAGPAGTYTITVTATDNCGATSTATFTLTVNAVNTPPTFTPAGAISRQQGSPAGAAVTVGTAADGETAAGNLTVTQIAGGTATGITVTGITNSNGTITALVAAGCTATSGTVRFQVTDGGGLMATGDVTVNVTTNTAPVQGTYANASVTVGGTATFTPNAAPSDNGTVVSVTAIATPNSFTGTFTGNATTGAVTVTNAG